MSDFKGRHFRGEIVLWAVRWYCRYGVSYRDLEEMMAGGGHRVDHSTIYRWVQHYASEIERRMEFGEVRAAGQFSTEINRRRTTFSEIEMDSRVIYALRRRYP